MLSVSQRARLLESIPTFLGGYTVKKLRKDIKQHRKNIKC